MCSDSPDDPVAILDRGVRALASGKVRLARHCFERALDLYRRAGDEDAVNDVLGALAHLAETPEDDAPQ